ncbi:MAG: hypothetical protein ACLQQ4_03355 [Bacteroidia bacterium]
MKLFSKTGFVVLLVLGFTSCMKQENYPDFPVITYKNFIINPDSTAFLQVNFTDGNGDLGNNSNGAPPDFYVEMLYDSIADNIDHFKPILIPGTVPSTDSLLGDTVASTYTIPDITPTGNNKELSGEIQVQMTKGDYYFTLSGVTIPNRYEYRVWLVDRAGHVSNRITTPVIITP